MNEEEIPVSEIKVDLELSEENEKLKNELANIKKQVEEKTSTKEETESKASKRKKLKESKAENTPKLPTLKQSIIYQEIDSDDWKRGKVIGVFKKSSI